MIGARKLGWNWILKDILISYFFKWWHYIWPGLIIWKKKKKRQQNKKTKTKKQQQQNKNKEKTKTNKKKPFQQCFKFSWAVKINKIDGIVS